MVDRRDRDGRVGRGKARFSRGKRIGYAAVACLVLSGCNAIVASGPSEETAFLDREVIPQVIKWGAGAVETFSFTRFSGARGYDEICIVPEYWSLNRIEDELGPIKVYHSTFGDPVPETFLAFVVVRKRIAHAVQFRSPDVDVGVTPGNLCVSAEKAVLRRFVRSYSSKRGALLEPGL